MKRTKIVATMGPACENKKILEQMIDSGMNIARLNFSHGSYAWHETIIKNIREISRKKKAPIGIIADLQGPRIRIGNDEEIKIEKGEIVVVRSHQKNKYQNGTEKKYKKIIYLDLAKAEDLVKIGNEILVEDGLLKMKIIGKSQSGLSAKVINGGMIKPRKGVNILGISGKLAALTAKDKEVLDFALRMGVDFVAMSFVRNAKEILNLRKLIKRKIGKNDILPQIIAKIERKEAIKNLIEILKATDAVMVARGDLAIEMPQEKIPILQKEIITKSLQMGKPSIVATQMLDSMIVNPRPTRAEITDVSNAVIDHADAVMLSGESASGKYPVDSVRVMKEIIETTEESPFDDLKHGFLGDRMSSISAAIAESAHELLKDSGAKAIVASTVSGFSARMISRHRPEQPLYVMTNNEKINLQMALIWGVIGFVLPDCKTLDDLIERSVETIKKNKLLKKGDKIIIVTGRPHRKKEHMSLVKVEEIS